MMSCNTSSMSHKHHMIAISSPISLSPLSLSFDIQVSWITSIMSYSHKPRFYCIIDVPQYGSTSQPHRWKSLWGFLSLLFYCFLMFQCFVKSFCIATNQLKVLLLNSDRIHKLANQLQALSDSGSQLLVLQLLELCPLIAPSHPISSPAASLGLSAVHCQPPPVNDD